HAPELRSCPSSRCTPHQCTVDTTRQGVEARITGRQAYLFGWEESGFRYAGDMLRIDRSIYDQIVAHARRDHPDEACGVVAGPEGSDRPERFIEMVNAERSPTFYRFDSKEQLKV